MSQGVLGTIAPPLGYATGPRYGPRAATDSHCPCARRNRVQLLGAACRAGHAGCLRGAAAELQSWLDDAQHYIAPNLRSLVYKYGMQQLSECPLITSLV